MKAFIALFERRDGGGEGRERESVFERGRGEGGGEQQGKRDTHTHTHASTHTHMQTHTHTHMQTRTHARSLRCMLENCFLVQGMGTDENVLAEVLAMRSNEQVRASSSSKCTVGISPSRPLLQ